METNRPIVVNARASGSISHALSTNKVLRNTYWLLSLTLLFSGAMAGLSMFMAAPYGISLMCSLVALGLLWFVVPRTADSANGIYVVFAVTGLLGFGLGPVLNMYINHLANGSQIVMMAFGMTGTAFLGLSAYAITSKKDFSFMRNFLFTGILVAFSLGIVSLVAAMFGYPLQPLALAVSAMFSALMCGMILIRHQKLLTAAKRIMYSPR